MAVGIGREANGDAYTGVALVHDTAQAAQENAALAQRRIAEASSIATGARWSRMFSAVDVRVDGRLLEITLHSSGIGPDFILRRDPLFAHE